MAVMDDYAPPYGPPFGPPRRGGAFPRGPGPRLPPLPYGSHPMGFFAPAPPMLPPAYPPPRYGGMGEPRRPGMGGGPPRGGVSKSRGGRVQQRSSNKRRKHQHKQQQARDAAGPTPRSVPPAPYNSNSYLIHAGEGSITPGHHATPLLGGEFHTVTPNPHGSVWKNAINIDREMLARAKETGVDVFGTNDDVLLSVGLQPRDDGLEWEDDMEFPDDVSDQDGDAEHQQGGGTTHDPTHKYKRQLAEQAAYIAELEERNMNLEDQVYILQREIKKLKGLPYTEDPPEGEPDAGEDYMPGPGEYDTDGVGAAESSPTHSGNNTSGHGLSPGGQPWRGAPSVCTAEMPGQSAPAGKSPAGDGPVG